jgi:hypothetical protein
MNENKPSLPEFKLLPSTLSDEEVLAQWERNRRRTLKDEEFLDRFGLKSERTRISNAQDSGPKKSNQP